MSTENRSLLSKATIKNVLNARGIEVPDQVIDQLQPMVHDVMEQCFTLRDYVETVTGNKNE